MRRLCRGSWLWTGTNSLPAVTEVQEQGAFFTETEEKSQNLGIFMYNAPCYQFKNAGIGKRWMWRALACSSGQSKDEWFVLQFVSPQFKHAFEDTQLLHTALELSPCEGGLHE